MWTVRQTVFHTHQLLEFSEKRWAGVSSCAEFAASPMLNPRTLRSEEHVRHHGAPWTRQRAYLANGVALGHRRLSLIDLEGGYQPMVRKSNHHVSELINAGQALGTNKKPNDIPVVSQNGEYAIVFNGEIYNYRDLAAVLKAEGWVLKTTSDTEVLLTGYIAWGEKVLDRIRGMFAFAMQDEQKRILFCARFLRHQTFLLHRSARTVHLRIGDKRASSSIQPTNASSIARLLSSTSGFQFGALPETFSKAFTNCRLRILWSCIRMAI